MAKKSGKIAKKYARALFEALEIKELQSYSESIEILIEIWDKTPELRAALLNPATSVSTREELLFEVAKLIDSEEPRLINFLRLLLENNRLNLVPLIGELFLAIVDDVRDALSLEITSAFDLSSQEKGDIESRIVKDFGEMAKVSWGTDKDIIGGLLIKSGDCLLDSSVKGLLQKVQVELSC